MSDQDLDLVETALIAVPPWPVAVPQDVAASIEARRKSTVVNGLRYLCAGFSYRKASLMAGCSMANLHDAVFAEGLTEIVYTSDRAMTLHRKVERAALEELSARAEGGAFAEEKCKDLTIQAAIHRDKIRDHEKSVSEHSGALDVLERMAHRIAKGEITLELKVSGPDPAREAVDVTHVPRGTLDDPAGTR